MTKVYVVTAPDAIRGIYEIWPACQAAVSGVKGARYQAVSSREEAEALLYGGGIQLTPGTYAFIDGNAAGGVGIVVVTQAEGRTTLEISTTVETIFMALPVRLLGLDTEMAISIALRDLRNVLAELAGAFHAIRLTPAETALTLVYDYIGIANWLEGLWKAEDPRLTTIIHKTMLMINEKQLKLRYHHQPGHRSTFAGRHDYAAFNARADVLATAATASLDSPTEVAS